MTLACRACQKVYAERLPGGERHRPGDPGRRVLHPARPLGLRQDHDLRMIAGLETPYRRPHLHRRPRLHPHPSARPRRGDGVPELRALSAHDGAREPGTQSAGAHGAGGARSASAWGKSSRMLGIEQLLDKKPGQLSGGQRQRVALGRAVIRRPNVFLMDEPLSNLDLKLRERTRTELKKLHETMRVTTVYVTHDQAEALVLSDRIGIMNGGELHAGGHAAGGLRPAGERLRGQVRRHAVDQSAERSWPGRLMAPWCCVWSMAARSWAALRCERLPRCFSD